MCRYVGRLRRNKASRRLLGRDALPRGGFFFEWWCGVVWCGVYVVCSVVSSLGLDNTFGLVGGYLLSCDGR